MHKLLLTLVAFSSGVFCNVEQILTDTVAQSFDSMGIMNNATENGHGADSVLSKPNLHDGHMGPYNGVNTCRMLYQLPSGYVAAPGIGAHKLHKRKVVWNKARKYCMAEGGYLIILNSDAEAALVMQRMKREDVPRAWLGVHNYFVNDEWVTLTGVEATGYDTWSPYENQPDNKNGTEHCVTLGNESGMFDDNCNELFSYICKINLC